MSLFCCSSGSPSFISMLVFSQSSGSHVKALAALFGLTPPESSHLDYWPELSRGSSLQFALWIHHIFLFGTCGASIHPCVEMLCDASWIPPKSM
jgi:hypothetical protein